MKSRTWGRMVSGLILFVLLFVMLTVPALAANFSKVYGTTLDRIRVRENASSSAATIDNIVSNRCVYVLQTKISGGITWIEVKYRAHEGNVISGWVAQTDGKTTFVKILSTTQSKSTYNVSNGDLPSKVAGAWTQKQREASKDSGSSGSAVSTSSSDTVKMAQTKLKDMGIYSGEITGNIGDKTKAAIKEFQKRNGLTADGILGSETVAKLQSTKTSSNSSSSNVSSDTIKMAQSKLKSMGIYSGEVTGKIGSKTTAAIKEFQKRNNLRQDGILGSETISKLNGAGGSSSSSSTGIGRGSFGTSVKVLQQNLTQLGYYWAEITGNFGEKTESAVKRFQEKNGLAQTGVANTETLNAIANQVAKKGGSSSSTINTSGVLRLNSTGSNVTALQTNLKVLGLYSGEITGHFGEKTEDAVKAAQKKYKLQVDGVAGPATLQAIAKAASGKSSSGSSTSGSTSRSTLTLGSTSSAVSTLQNNLAALGLYSGDVTGHYGSLTQSAVKAFQKKKGLSATGNADASTQQAIANAVSGKSGGSSSNTSTSLSLRLNDKGTEVTKLQQALTKLKYYYGDITGSYGSLTQKAVKKFQEDNGLTVDGVAGSKTIALINSKAGSSVNPRNNSGSSSSSGGNSTSSAALYGRITKSNVKLHKEANISSSTVCSMRTNTLLKITQRLVRNGTTWYAATASQDGYRYKGYVRSDMVTLISYADYNASTGGSSTSSHDNEIDGVIRITSNVNLREGPSKDDKKVGEAYSGDYYYYVNYSNGWYELTNGLYVSSSYAERLDDKDATDLISDNSGTYRYDDEGDMVSWIQTALTQLKYYSADITGHFGNKTEDAVRSFQEDHGLTADGIAGPKTIAALRDAVSSGSGGTSKISGVVHDLDWSKITTDYKKQLGFVAKNESCTLIDLQTGKTMKIHVQSAGNHLDAEPLRASDTATLCSLYGVSSASNISYLRRPMILVTGGKQLLCSIYATPHGQQDITNNNYPGQFCLHFKNSKTSGTKVVSGYAKEALEKGRTIIKNTKDASMGKDLP